MKNNTLNFSDILALKEAGLVTDSDFLSFSFEASTAGTTTYLFYGSLVLFLEREQDTPEIDNRVGVLTKAGTELMKLISIQPDMEYVKFVTRKFNREGMKIAWAPVLREEEGSIHIGDKTYLTTDPG